MPASDTTLSVTSADKTAPSNVTVTRVSTSATQFTMSSSDTISGSSLSYYVSKDSTTAPAATAGNCSGANTLNCWYTGTTFTISSAGTYRAWAKDGAGNVSASAGSIVAYTVYNYNSPNTTLVVKLINSDGTNIAEGSSAVALATTPIYISASADGGYSLKYICTSTSTTACTTNSVTSGSTVSLSNNMYVFANSESAGISNGATMQSITKTMCNNLTQTNTVFTLTDERDNKIYQVKKLGDGNCWMTQNLALYGGQTISSTYSNVSSNYALPSSTTSGFSSNTVKNMYNGSHTNNSASSTGSYYNARVANALEASTSVSAKDYTDNICPKGWTLPTNSQQNTVRSYASNYGIVYAGLYGSGSLGNSGSYGLWWSRTAYSSTTFYYMGANSGSLSTNATNIYYGFSVRCLVK